jgi:hypothetical protein
MLFKVLLKMKLKIVRKQKKPLRYMNQCLHQCKRMLMEIQKVFSPTDVDSRSEKGCISLGRLVRRNVRLKEKLQEYEVLNRHIETENELRIIQNTHLRAKVERLKGRQTEFLKKMQKIEKIAHQRQAQIRRLKKQVRQLKIQTVPGFQVLINSPIPSPVA